MVRHMLGSALLLAAFTVAATGLVVVTHDATAERIAAAEKAALLQKLHTLIPPERHDNNLFDDHVQVRDPVLLGTPEPMTLYRARHDDHVVAAVLTTVAPDGYSGNIHLLVAVNRDGTLAGVRVTRHRETPGLGDKIDVTRSNWITRFAGHSLTDPLPERWGVKRDGGEFDQFTGATITPRAVVKAVYNTLRFVAGHHDEIFATANEAEEEHHE